MRIALGLAILGASILLACSSSTSSGSGSDGGTIVNPGSDGGTGDAATNGALTGTINGSAFTPVSSLANAHDGALDIIFSSADDVCGASKSGVARSGEILVQLYLTSAALGPHASPDDEAKVARVAQNCPTGDKIAGHVDYGTTATTHTVTLDYVGTDEVRGSLSLTFDDGSVLAGSFSATGCTATLSENALCK